MGDVPLPGLHQIQVGRVVLFIHQQFVHTNDTGCDGDHSQTGLPGLLLVAHIQLRKQLLCKALHSAWCSEKRWFADRKKQLERYARLVEVWSETRACIDTSGRVSHSG